MINDVYRVIYSDKMNNLCFDCGIENPNFISINNGIFLCEQCANIHLSFPEGISIIVQNDLDSLSDKDLQYLIKGGNTRLNDFILDEYPDLENLSQRILYKTKALDYYRKRLRYYVLGGTCPVRPSQEMGCRLIDDNLNSKVKTFRPNRPVTSRIVNDDNKEEDYFNDPFKEMKNKFKDDDFFNKFFEGDDYLFGNGVFDNEDNDKMYKTIVPEQITHRKPSYNTTVHKKSNLSQSINPYMYNDKTRKKDTENNEIKEEEPKKKKKYFNHVRVNKGPSNNLFKSTVNSSNNFAKNLYIPKNVNMKKIEKEEEKEKENEKENEKEKEKEKEKIDSDGEIEKEFERVEKEDKKNQNSNLKNCFENSNNKNNNSPFDRRDSTELIILPDHEENLLQKKKRPSNNEIPAEFSKQAKGLSHLTNTINEKDELQKDKNNINSTSDPNSELESNSISKTTNDDTFRNSIRNKYKKRKSQTTGEESKENEIKQNTNKIENNEQNENKEFNKKNFVKEVSKMNFTETNWNINQLGDVRTYPESLLIEAD